MIEFESIAYVATLLVAAHYLCDFPLQGDFMAQQKGKNKLILFGHSAIHAGAVLLITGSVLLAWLELVFHYAIDREKCRGGISATADQLLHLFCKLCILIVWVLTHGH